MKSRVNKKVILIVSGALISLLFALSPIFIIMGFFGANVTDDYVENNYEFASTYRNVLNKNLKYGKGYVSLSRILYFYLEDNSLSFEEIYSDNLDTDLNKQTTIYDTCTLDKYKSMSVCKGENIESLNQINVDMNKPFNSPLEISNLNVTSFFMQERIVYGEFDVHGGWDFASPSETPVYSVCDGIVENVKFNEKQNVINIGGGYGNMIKIKCELEDITYSVIYGHLFPNSTNLKVGDDVKHWQEIASVGTTGYSTGNHLHFEVYRNTKRIDGVSLIDFNFEKDSKNDEIG